MTLAPDARPTLENPDDDPFLWLEEVEGAEAIAWVEAQNEKTLALLSDARVAADAAALKAMMDRPDKIPHVTRRGGLLYNYWQDAEHPRGLWRRTTFESYRSETPDWELLLDLDALAAAEGEDWIWKGATTLPPRHVRALLRLSRGGGDAVVLREFDLASHAFVPGGFDLPEGKSSAAWLDHDTLILSSALGEGMATDSGYPRTIRRWVRGQDPMTAPVLFQVAANHMGSWGGVDRSAKAERVVFFDQIGFFDMSVFLGDRSGPRWHIDLPTDMRINWDADWVVLQPRTPWKVGETTYPPDTLLGTSLSALLDNRRDLTVLFEPAPRRALDGFFWCAGRLVLSVLDDLRPVHTVWTPSEEGAWTSRPLGGLPEIGVVSVWPLDAEPEESDGTLLAQTQDPVTPPTLLQTSASQLATPLVLRQAPRLFNADGLRVTRHEAISSDGERIPYVQTGPDGETGDAPVHLTGYGGFQVTMQPSYRGSIGHLWLERGGTAVVAHIRGGGEFGTRWHEAGRRENKRLSHDDFAAVAADLVRRGVTVPGRVAAEGGSNGGLLIANMLTRYPERFGALFCTIPLIDMRRYTKLLAGASWIAEYGDPAVPEDWAFMQHFSAYHAAEPGRHYPPILIATTRRDDRVHPGHARKMAAKLQKLGYDARFYEPAAGGHGYGKDNAETARFMALGSAFLRRAIGWESK
ncbi:S9 family peptidase [Pseudoroseomonas wenyumeiae]|uniref:S9 family peptidase n=1 Tax=Teichococcus wenyumeiae TaxID=2478470 RepID=A0A3A9JWE0_9PROT|nr:prolyl oligopeptidase family serine peptidase [Pseudoroseomonas wenyumeiae]RKK05088.1 S9 family peptidase [Pseudoroseomonas wenyumeiae]RMI20914.1 S9 family peptidase [Pseudoroseomonas wenyumeiae]